jgi:hypothetical protein
MFPFRAARVGVPAVVGEDSFSDDGSWSGGGDGSGTAGFIA